jgi:hypothetical protein
VTARFRYTIGAAIVLVLSLGFASIIYGIGFLPFDFVALLAWALGPLGIFTLIVAFTGTQETATYLSWGSILFAIALASILYPIINILAIFGGLLVALAIISLVAHLRYI